MGVGSINIICVYLTDHEPLLGFALAKRVPRKLLITTQLNKSKYQANQVFIRLIKCLCKNPQN
jgi:hypothetical protein